MTPVSELLSQEQDRLQSFIEREKEKLTAEQRAELASISFRFAMLNVRVHKQESSKTHA